MQVNNAPASYILVQNPGEVIGQDGLMVGMQSGQPVPAAPGVPVQRVSPRPQPALAAIQAALPPRVPSTTERLRRNMPLLLTIGGIADATGATIMVGRAVTYALDIPVSSDFRQVSTVVAPVVMAAGLALMGAVAGAHFSGPNDPPLAPHGAAPEIPGEAAEPLAPVEFTVVTVDTEAAALPEGEAYAEADAPADPPAEAALEAVRYTRGDSPTAAERPDDLRLDIRELETTAVSPALRSTV